MSKLIFDPMSTEVQSFYSKFSSINDMLNRLKEKDGLLEYLKEMSKYRVTRLAVVKDLTGNIYQGALLDSSGTLIYEFGGIKNVTYTKEELKEQTISKYSLIAGLAESTVLEIKYCIYLILSGNTDRWIEEKYRNLSKAIELKESNIGYSCDKLYELTKGLNNKFIPLPRYLVDNYNQVIEPWYKEEAVISILKYLGKSEEDSRKIMASDFHLIRVANRIIQDTEGTKEREEIANLMIKFIDTYDVITNHGKRNLGTLIKFTMKEVYYTHASNGDRLSTVYEAANIVDGVYKNQVYFLPEEKREKLIWLAYCSTGDIKYTRMIGKKSLENDDSLLVKGDKIRRTLMESFYYLSSTEFLNQDSFKLSDGAKEIKYLPSATDEIKNSGLRAKLEAVRKHTAGSKNSYNMLANDIASKALSSSKILLSTKQINIINRVYENIGNEEEIQKGNLYDESIEFMIKELLNKNNYRKNKWMSDFIKQIRDRKRCSEAQLEVLKKEYNSTLAVYNGKELIDEDGIEQMKVRYSDEELDNYDGNSKAASLLDENGSLAEGKNNELDVLEEEKYDLDSLMKDSSHSRYMTDEEKNESEYDSRMLVDEERAIKTINSSLGKIDITALCFDSPKE